MRIVAAKSALICGMLRVSTGMAAAVPFPCSSLISWATVVMVEALELGSMSMSLLVEGEVDLAATTTNS